jgi:signal transduction histidine kinase/ligand-binding sensor domain-containing protein
VVIRLLQLVVFFISMASAAVAQTTAPFQYESIPGLSQNTAYAISKDKQGFLWIATANGLNRFDGGEIKVYKPGIDKAPGQMKGRIIRSELMEDEQERIWFSTDITVHCFNKKTEEFYTYDLTQKKAIWLPGDTSARIGIFANPVLKIGSHIWFATINKGLFDLNTTTNESTQYPLLLKDEGNNPIQLMYNGVYDGKNKLWFASNKGLLSFDLKTLQWQRLVPGKAFYTVSFCSDTLFISEGKEIVWVDINTFQYDYLKFNERDNTSNIERDVIHRVYTDKKLNTWAGDESGNVYCKPLHASAFRWMGNINVGGAIRTNYPVYCFYADSSGILWTGAYMLGLIKAETDQQEFYTYPKIAANKVVDNLYVNAIYEDENDKVWLGTFQKGIVILDKKSGTIAPLKLPYTGPPLIYGNSVHQIREDSKGNLWTGISGRLFVKEKGSGSFKAIKIPAPTNALQYPQVWSFAGYKDGWLVGTTIGLYFLKKVNDKYVIEYLTRFGQTRILDIWNNNDKEVWIAFESEGLAVIRDPFENGPLKKLFTETNVKSFYNDWHILWISASSGLISYDLTSGRFKYFSEKEGLLNSYVFGVLPDADKLWISTNHGLFRSEIFFKKDSVLPDATFTNFTINDGLPDNQFNNWAFHKGKSGNLYFATAKGLVWFKPSEIKPGVSMPRLHLIDFLANEEKPISKTASEYISDISLPYFKNNLFFRFKGIDFNNATKINYMYKLEGWDKDWIYSGRLNEVRYSNLPHGNYTFKFKASNSSGVWNDNEYAVTIRIHPPFWKTWWFYTLSIIAVSISIIFITRFFAQQKLKIKIAELQKQKEIDKERQRISREMHDDIGAGLTQITLMSESVKNKLGLTGKKEMEDIGGTSRKLVNNMSEIIWSLNPENKTLGHLFAYLREELNKQLEYSGMEYNIQLPDKGQDIMLTHEQRRNLLLVTKEIVNNAVKYSQSKNVSVNAELTTGKLKFEIKDDGIGFDIHKTSSGNGLRNIKQRIAECNGQLIINTSPQSGTRFTYSIPLQ